MTVYADDREVFDRRPGALAFAVTCFCIVLLAAQFTTLGLGVADAVLSWLRGAQLEVWLHAPLADSPALLAGPYAAHAAGAMLILALLLAWTWPVDGPLSSLLGAYVAAQTLLAFALTVLFDPTRFTDLARKTGVETRIWVAVFAILGVVSVLAIERRTVAVTARVIELDTPLRRFGWWALRLLPGFGLLGAASFLNGYRTAAWTLGAILIVTLLENLSRAPRPSHASPRNQLLREAAAALPLVTALVVAGSVYTFGFEAAGQPQKVVSFSPKTRAVALKSPTTPPEKPVIDIRWSKSGATSSSP